jgi:hypothetical protein
MNHFIDLHHPTRKMFYTISFSLIGYWIAYLVCKMLGYEPTTGRFGIPSGSSIVVLVCTIFSAGIGFAYGTNRLLLGHYFPSY